MRVVGSARLPACSERRVELVRVTWWRATAGLPRPRSPVPTTARQVSAMLRSRAPPQPGRQRCHAARACAGPGGPGLEMRPRPRSRRASPLIRHWPREARRGASPGGGHPRLLHPMAHQQPTRPGTARHHRAPPLPHDLPVALRAHPLRHRTGYAARPRWARARLCAQQAVDLSVGLRGWAGLSAGSWRHDGEGQQRRRADAGGGSDVVAARRERPSGVLSMDDPGCLWTDARSLCN